MTDITSAASDPPYRVMVTGANGFVGLHLISDLSYNLPTSSRIFACCRDAGARVEMAETVPLDLTNKASIEKIVRQIMPTHLVHLAAISDVPTAGVEPDIAWRINLLGTLFLADALARYCPESQFVFAGSAEIYGGSFDDTALDENAQLAPRNTYACTKAAADLALGSMAADGLRVVRLRPFNHTGPGQSENFVIAALAAQIARIEKGLQPPEIHVGNLDSERDFLDVRDVVTSYRKVIQRSDSLPSGLVLNIASSRRRAVRSILNELVTLSETPVEIVLDPTRLRSSDTPLVLGNSSKARSLLDWEPIYDWSQTLTDVLNYWRNRKS